MATLDTSELDALNRDLEQIPAEKLPQLKGVVRKGALNIKTGMQSEAASAGSYRHFSRSISFDEIDGGLGAEIGPDKGRVQGALGNILYFGTSKNAPVLDLEGPLRKEDQRFVDAIADVAEDIL
jgi:hypothetical protein